MFCSIFFFFACLKVRFNFEQFRKNDDLHGRCIFELQDSEKQCLKNRVSKDPSTSNMVNGPKHCWNLNDSTFTIFIDRCEENHALKIFCDWYWKSSDCLLTHWLPMTSILFLTEAIYCNIFRCNYLRNEKNFRNFFLHFLNLDSILNIFKKKITLIADAFLNLGTPK